MIINSVRSEDKTFFSQSIINMAWESYIIPVIIFAIGIALIALYGKEKDESPYKKTYKAWGIVGIVLGVVMIFLTWFFTMPSYPPVRYTPPRPQTQMAAVRQATNQAINQINETANQAVTQINQAAAPAPIESAIVEQPNGMRNVARRNNIR